MEFETEITKYTVINLEKLKTNKTKCPNCGNEFKSVGKKVICPECKFIFKNENIQ